MAPPLPPGGCQTALPANIVEMEFFLTAGWCLANKHICNRDKDAFFWTVQPQKDKMLPPGFLRSFWESHYPQLRSPRIGARESKRFYSVAGLAQAAPT